MRSPSTLLVEIKIKVSDVFLLETLSGTDCYSKLSVDQFMCGWFLGE